MVVPVHVRAPSSAGTHRLHLDLVHEDVRWLGVECGCSVVVRRRRRVAFLGTEPPSIRDRLAREPEVEPIVIGEGFGYPTAPSPAAFLLGESRWLPAAFPIRAARLVVAARSRWMPLPRDGREFLDVLASCEELVDGASTVVTLRERWVRRLILFVARLLRVRVT
jgi:hypothetical protein